MAPSTLHRPLCEGGREGGREGGQVSESVWEEWLHPHRTGHCVREGGREGGCVCGGGGRVALSTPHRPLCEGRRGGGREGGRAGK